MKQVMITGVLVFLVLALFSCTTILPAHSNDPAIASGMSESPLFPTEDEFSAAEEIPTEPPAWTHIFMENYAIYKILGKTDETIQFPTWDGIIWQKYGCEIVYMFPEEDYWQEPQPGDVDETGLGFGEQHNDEIWIPETESAMISDGMYLLISPKKYHLNNKEYWMPDICDGKTEYLRFLDGKLSVPEGALDTGAFSYLKAVNAVGEDYKDDFCKLFNKGKERIKPEVGNRIFFISTCDDNINTEIWVTIGARGPLFRDYALIDLRAPDVTKYRLDMILVKVAKSYRDSYGYILVPSMLGNDRFNCHGLKKDNTLSFIHWINYFPEYLLKTIGETRIKEFARKHPGVTYKDGMLRLCDPILDLALPEHLELFNEAQELLK